MVTVNTDSHDNLSVAAGIRDGETGLMDRTPAGVADALQAATAASFAGHGEKGLSGLSILGISGCAFVPPGLRSSAPRCSWSLDTYPLNLDFAAASYFGVPTKSGKERGSRP